jgi:hypothetical protein
MYNVTVQDIKTMAMSISKSGLFGIKTEDQAMALMLIAQAEGLHPAIAARDYHVIQGKPALKADAMLARFQTAGGKVSFDVYTDKKVSATLSHPQGGTVKIEWTIEMADRAGLTKNPTWKQYPRQMLRARVISEGIRTVYPGVAVGVYTPEEVEDFPMKSESHSRKMKDIQPDVVDESTGEVLEMSAPRKSPKEQMQACETLESLQALFKEFWTTADKTDRAAMEKTYNACKAKLIAEQPPIEIEIEQ